MIDNSRGLLVKFYRDAFPDRSSDGVSARRDAGVITGIVTRDPATGRLTLRPMPVLTVYASVTRDRPALWVQEHFVYRTPSWTVVPAESDLGEHDVHLDSHLIGWGFGGNFAHTMDGRLSSIVEHPYPLPVWDRRLTGR